MPIIHTGVIRRARLNTDSYTSCYIYISNGYYNILPGQKEWAPQHGRVHYTAISVSRMSRASIVLFSTEWGIQSIAITGCVKGSIIEGHNESTTTLVIAINIQCGLILLIYSGV